MLNKVIVEGYIATTWRFGSDLMIKLACYRDPYLPQQKTDDGKDKPDYVLARLVNGFAQNIDFEKRKQIRIEGFIRSIDTEESLQEFLSRSNAKDAQSKFSVEVVGGRAQEVLALRSFMEVQVLNYSVIMPRASETVATPKAVVPTPAPKAVKKNESPSPQKTAPAETKKDVPTAGKRNDLKTDNKKSKVVMKKK